MQVAQTDVDALDGKRQLVVGSDGCVQVGVDVRAAPGRGIERPGTVREVWPAVHM